MKAALFALLGMVALAVPGAHAVPLIADGISYTLESTAITANTHRFALVISGENTGFDTEGGGRTGINAIAFNNVSMGQPITGSMVVTLFNNVVNNAPTFAFATGGLNATGCNGTGNFFCFDNLAIPPLPTTLLAGPIVLVFDATLSSGTWAGFHPDFKIEWVGTKSNIQADGTLQSGYDLVSLAIDVGTVCPDCSPTPFVTTPEPASLAIVGMGLLGLAAFRRRR
jgi:hypothetical protein